VRLIERYPVLEVSAFAVIALLGLKLLMAIPVHYFPHLDWLENETTDLVISVVTAAFFFIPVLFDRFITQKKG
jgi:predicted tellurium resistance membrane protein TerC